MEEQVQIPLPDIKDLTGILKHHLRQSDRNDSHVAMIEEDWALERLCVRQIRSSGADVEKLIKLARARARREGRDLAMVDQLQFEEAMEISLIALLAGREAERLLLGRIAAGFGGAARNAN